MVVGVGVGMVDVPTEGIRVMGGGLTAVADFGEAILRVTDDRFVGVAGRILGRGDDSARLDWSCKPSPLLR